MPLVGIPAGVVERDIRNAVFDEPPCDEQRLPDCRSAVAVARLGGLEGKVEHLRGVALGDAASLRACRVKRRRQRGVRRSLRRTPRIYLGQHFKAPLRDLRRHARRRHNAVDYETRRVWLPAGDERRGIGAEEPDLAEAPFRARQNHVWRKLPSIRAALRLGNHGPYRRAYLAPAGKPPRLHEIRRALVPVVPVGHGADYGIEVCALGELRPPFVYLHPWHIGGNSLQPAVEVSRRIRLRVECLKLAWAAPKPDFNDALSLFHCLSPPPVRQMRKRNSFELTRLHASSRGTSDQPRLPRLLRSPSMNPNSRAVGARDISRQ